MIKRLEAHSGYVNCIAYNPFDTNEIASGSSDKSIIVWDIEKSIPIGRLDGHESSVRCIAYNPSRFGFISSGSFDKKIIVWEFSRMKPVDIFN